MIRKQCRNVREKKPLIHNITNYVTVNDCANVLLACGASPIMSDDINEVCDITSICDGLNINIGTLNERTVESMLAAGKKANELGHPVVLDPVGAGASGFRTNTALKLINEVKFSVIRGNISEIKALVLGIDNTRGVDANINDVITRENEKDTALFAMEFAKKTGAVIAITGAIDIVADKNNAYAIYNGNKMMSLVTGTGCQLSALTAAYVTANKDEILEAVVAGVALMGVAGEIAYDRMKKEDGNASYRSYIIDAICNIQDDELSKRACITKIV